MRSILQKQRSYCATSLNFHFATSQTDTGKCSRLRVHSTWQGEGRGRGRGMRRKKGRKPPLRCPFYASAEGAAGQSMIRRREERSSLRFALPPLRPSFSLPTLTLLQPLPAPVVTPSPLPRLSTPSPFPPLPTLPPSLPLSPKALASRTDDAAPCP